MSYGGFLRNSTGLKSNQCQKPLTLETYHPNYLFKEGELTTKILGTQTQLRSAEYRIKTGALIHHLVNEIIKKIIVKKKFYPAILIFYIMFRNTKFWSFRNYFLHLIYLKIQYQQELTESHWKLLFFYFPKYRRDVYFSD